MNINELNAFYSIKTNKELHRFLGGVLYQLEMALAHSYSMGHRKHWNMMVNKVAKHDLADINIWARILVVTKNEYTLRLLRKKIFETKPELKGLPDEWLFEVLKKNS